MKTPTMPGYTAEKSVYKARGRYRSPAGGAGPVPPMSNALLPQLRKIDWECASDCLGAGGDMGICSFFCEEQGDGGGGGIPEPTCRPECSSMCGPSSEGLTGLWKTCIRADCETYEVRCRSRGGF